VIISLATVFFRLGGLPLTGADEPRYARIAQEMWQAGKWVTPRLQDHPWLEKPPLYYWMTIPFYALAGVNETTARFGPALCALVAAWATCWAGAQLWSPLAGLLAGSILLTTIGFSVFARGASTDMPLAAFFTLALGLLAVRAAGKMRGRAKLLMAYIFLGLAALAKGPVALLLCAGVVVMYWALDERGGSVRGLFLLPGLVLAAAVAFPWFWLAFRENGYSFIAVYFVNHNFARYVSEVHHHAQPFYYYGPVLLGLFFPWTGWLAALAEHPPAKLRSWRTWDAAPLFVACWFLFPIVFFSLSASKLPGYILVSLPPLALLMGAASARWIEAKRSCSGVTAAAAWLHLLTSIAIASAFPIVMKVVYSEDWKQAIPIWAAVVFPAFFALYAARRGRWKSAMIATVAQGMIMVLALTQFAFPVIADHHSARGIATEAILARGNGEPLVTYGYFHHTLFYYTDYRIDAELKEPDELQVFALGHPRFLVVTEGRYLAEFDKLSGFACDLLAQQGKLCLLRVRHR